MQKIIRATNRAKTQARRKSVIEKAQNKRSEYIYQRYNEKVRDQDFRSAVRAARSARREDWLLGPLAPRRDVGEMKDVYGTVNIRQLQRVDKGDGRWKDWCIREGDRVVITGSKQRDRGKIGIVSSVNEKAEDCIVKGFNLVDVKTPAYLLVLDPDKTLIRTTEASIPLSDVRLVYPLPHPETGMVRDVIIKELRRLQKNGPRYIAGLQPLTHIPFPPITKPDHPEHEIDTLRIEVEEETWTPTLIRPPMPGSIIDELRNKYSVFRDRHDEVFVQGMERRAARRASLEKVKMARMVTPLQELNKLERKERAKKGRKVLDEETLRGIGELMARQKGEVREKEAVVA